jgi:hypothetical protein
VVVTRVGRFDRGDCFLVAWELGDWPPFGNLQLFSVPFDSGRVTLRASDDGDFSSQFTTGARRSSPSNHNPSNRRARGSPS